jgi:hypothetical protein
LLAKLSGSRCTVLSYQCVDRVGCWVPVMSHGAKCFDASALCGRAFMSLVNQVVNELNDADTAN